MKRRAAPGVHAARGEAARGAAAPTVTVADLARDVAEAADPLTGAREDLDPLLGAIGDAHVVLLGEATHGTHEFYRLRGEITRRLVEEKGFCAVAVEGDWPDCLRVNRWIRGGDEDRGATDALGDFRRFPSWMWRNADVLDFLGWLRDHDTSAKPRDGVGFYGLDLYSLHASAAAVLGYLDRVDPSEAVEARRRYACLDVGGRTDGQAYGVAAHRGLAPTCAEDVLRQLVELQRSRTRHLSRDGRAAEDEFFFAEQNARLVQDAERYYRTMFTGRVSSWNLRDRHMADTLDALIRHLSGRTETAKVVVWAHNSHVGDARATWMGDVGELNIGQLARERWGTGAFLLGFTTYDGTVTAARDWDEPPERRRVRPALRGSVEELFHHTGLPRFLLVLRGRDGVVEALREPMLERAIGVVYRPETERASHYFECRVAEQFDAVVHVDHTRAVEPIERDANWDRGEPPDTFPTGF